MSIVQAQLKQMLCAMLLRVATPDYTVQSAPVILHADSCGNREDITARMPVSLKGTIESVALER